MGKVYCVGDVHGDYDRLVVLLERKGIVRGDPPRWSAGDATLVFIGDLTDRCRRGIDVIRLIMQLQREAALEGGFVDSLMGNHDPLLLAVAYELRGQEADPDAKYFFRLNGGRMVEAEAVAADPEVFAWLQRLPLMLKVRSTVFQHADGMHYYRHLGAAESIEVVNEKGRQLASVARGAYALFNDLTPERYWNGFPHLLASYLADLGVERVVHGHTRNETDGPLLYLDGLAISVDNGLCWTYRQDEGRGCVLDLDDLSPGSLA